MKNIKLETLINWLKQYNLFDDEIDSIDTITRLDLSNKQIKELPDSFGLLKNLVVLNLANNKLNTLPISMKDLTSLSNLDIRRNRFEVLPDVIQFMPLRALNASGNRLTDASILQKCSDLRVLDLSANVLTCMNECLAVENELRTLNLSYNLLKDVTNIFSRLINLERINLNGNLLENIPNEIKAMQSLEELEISDNKIEKIDDAFYDLDLESVDFSSNMISALHLKHLDSLENLILDSNPLSKLEFDKTFAPYLKELSCDSCMLDNFVLPPSKHLNVLCYSSNSIKTISDDIGQYVELSELDIDKNSISILPDSLANLLALKTLYIDSNPLSEQAKKIISILDPEICDINMKSGISIEKATEDDLPEMAKLLAVLFEIESDFEIDYNKQLSGITTLFNEKSSDILVAKHEGRVVGMITMQRLISSAAGDFIGQMEDLVVEKDYRKMGVGSRLINQMRNIAQNHGYKRIQLAADANNDNALHFYNRRGFRRTHLSVHHF